MLTSLLTPMRRRLMPSSSSLLERSFTHNLSNTASLNPSFGLLSRLFSSKSTASSTSSSAASTPASKSSSAVSKRLFRLDNYPFFGIQPHYNTPKSSINQNLELEDVAS